MDYTQLESYFAESVTSSARVYIADDADKAIEVLQARVVELDHDTADLAMLADQYKAERDTLAAKLAALEKQGPVAWIKYLIGAECKADGRCYDMIFCPMEGYKPLYLAAGAQPDTTALEYMTGYSDGKAWAEAQAEPLIVKSALTGVVDQQIAAHKIGGSV